jgi:hypothetical protein
MFCKKISSILQMIKLSKTRYFPVPNNIFEESVWALVLIVNLLLLNQVP